MINEVEEFLNKYEIRNKPVIIAFSSGPDSCALASIINELKDKYKLEVTLAYFNHMWRKEAEAEEDFTIEFASKNSFNHIMIIINFTII